MREGSKKRQGKLKPTYPPAPYLPKPQDKGPLVSCSSFPRSIPIPVQEEAFTVAEVKERKIQSQTTYSSREDGAPFKSSEGVGVRSSGSSCRRPEFSSTHSPPVTTVPRDLMSSYGLRGYQVYTWYTYIQAGKNLYTETKIKPKSYKKANS